MRRVDIVSAIYIALSTSAKCFVIESLKASGFTWCGLTGGIDHWMEPELHGSRIIDETHDKRVASR